MWAREKIRLYDDFNTVNTQEFRIREITSLGLKYNLLTKYTSFVAVDHMPVVENGGNTRQVKQPLPLPQGVSNLAVGFEMDLGEMVVDSERITGVEVVVECEDQVMKKITEAILESHFSDMHLMDIIEFIGYAVKLEIHPDGRIIVKNRNDIKVGKMLESLERGLKAIGYDNKDVIELRINIFSL